MSAQDLGSRAIRGMYFQELEISSSADWLDAVSNEFDSDQASEEYPFLGQVPTMQLWKGERKTKVLRDDKFVIINDHFESTMRIEDSQRRRDKTKQLETRISEHVRRGDSHWSALLATLIINGESTNGFDGEYFFDVDHNWGDGDQSNDIDANISDYPVSTTGSTTSPSAEEANFAVMAGIRQLVSFTDDQGEPVNEDANEFMVLCPLSLEPAITSGVTNPKGTGLAEQFERRNIKVKGLARLSTWTDKFVVIRTDSFIKPWIRQQETDLRVSSLAEDSDFHFMNDAFLFGIDAWRQVGYGRWDLACLVTLI